jgi:hypothetical protein
VRRGIGRIFRRLLYSRNSARAAERTGREEFEEALRRYGTDIGDDGRNLEGFGFAILQVGFRTLPGAKLRSVWDGSMPQSRRGYSDRTPSTD